MKPNILLLMTDSAAVGRDGVQWGLGGDPELGSYRT